MLIDLSPPQQLDNNIASTSGSHLQNGISILDAPIDIPTEGGSSSSDLSSTSMFSSLEMNKLEPPPYQSPPTYMNTYGIAQYHSTSSVANDFMGMTLNTGLEKTSSSSSFDPFDTSHIAPSSKSYNSTVMFDNLRKENKSMVNKNQESTIRNRPIYTSQLDDLVHNTMASLSPKNSHSSLTNMPDTNGKQVNQSLNIAQNGSNDYQLSYGTENRATAEAPAGEDSTLNDSLQVNLSSLTLNDTDESLSAANLSANQVDKDSENEVVKKFDKSFLAELEKEMYKKDVVATNINMNSSQSYASQSSNKENTVNAIPSTIYSRTGAYSNTNNTRIYNEAVGPTPGTTMSPSGKFTNTYTKSTNQDIASGKSIYESNTSRSYYTASPNNSPIILNKKQQNIDQSKSSVGTSLNQMWIDRQTTMPSASSSIPNQTYSNEQAIYSNYSASNLYSNTNVLPNEHKHNFVAVSNRPSPVLKNQQQPQQSQQQQQTNTRANLNLYNSITSDIYGSISSGNIYDVVAVPNATPVNSNCYDVFSEASAMTTTTATSMTNTKSNIENYYEAIQTNESQTVIYDEVAGEEILRPHRPAPIAPPVLSAQQIQRRLERAQKEQQLYGNIVGSASAMNGNLTMNNNTNDLQSQQKVLALLNEISCDGCGDATEQDATLALQACNWDHSSAVHHFKIERLHRYVKFKKYESLVMFEN